MAYITTETVKNIRQALKKEFPEIKFSVRKSNHSSVSVSIVKSPYFEDGEERQINHYWIKETAGNEKQVEVATKINEIIQSVGGYYDKSDSMTDYFNVAFYYDIMVGRWDRPHEKV